VQIGHCYVRSLRVCASDRSSHRNEDMAGGRRDRHASWIRWPECEGADRARTATVLWTCVRFPRSQGRHRQASVVGRRRPVLVCQASGTRTIHLAASHRRNGLSDACAVIDAPRRHRLAPAAEDLDAGDRGVIDMRDSPLFMYLLLMHSDLFDGILCAWIPLRCRILTGSIERL